MENAKNDWWRSAVIYQVYPQSFCGRNNPHGGDLAGITSKVDYIKKLGVDMVWVSPFFPSPLKDYGYDVSNYVDVNPIYGTLADFDQMVERFHANGIKVMIDQVYNHTSDVHPWFVESKKDTTNSKADWYVWKDPTSTGNPPNNWISVFSGPAWTWNSSRKQYYLHQFLSSQPDLNFNNPQVQQAILDAAEFWCKRGVDGFRLDTVNRYVQHPDYPDNPPSKTHTLDNRPVNPMWMQEERYNQGQPGNLEFLAKLRQLMKRNGDKILLGEIGSYNEMELQGLYTTGDDYLHIGYNFMLLNNEVTPRNIQHAVAEVERYAKDGWPCWSFSNHDVVRVVSRSKGVDSAHQPALAKMLLSLLVSLRGTICMYQGEELGLPEAPLSFEELKDPWGITLWPDYPSRDGCRTPMPWDSTARYGGFSSDEPWLPIKPLHSERSVNLQEADDSSVLHYCRRLLAWRKQQSALLGTGALQIVSADDSLLHFVRAGVDGAADVHCYFNFSAAQVDVKATGAIVDGQPTAATATGGAIVLPAYSSVFVS